MQLSNQGFLTYSYRSGDTQAPIIVIDGDDAFLRTAEYGKKFEVFAATATDALTLGATCRVSVTSPSGKIIASGISASEPFTVDGDEYGFYSIVYAASDKYGNSSQKTVTVRIKDTVAPVINATVKLPSTVKVGKTVTLPKFTATDNLDKSPFIALFVVDAHGRYHTVEQGAKYSFTEKGKYKIVLYARDEAMNTARQEYTITAE